MKKFSVKDLSICYSDDNESLRKINIEIEANAITVLFGPAGGGKSTFLRVLNRLNDLADVKTMTGKVLFNGTNILDPKLDVIELRRKIGMVFSRPVPLPLTIYENVAYGLIMAGERNKKKLDQAVESALRQAVLWDEVYDRLSDSGFAISGGQQQRVSIARALANDPPIIIADEPTGSLDSITADHVFGVFEMLKNQGRTIIMVTHDKSLSPRFTRTLVIQDGELALDSHKEAI